MKTQKNENGQFELTGQVIRPLLEKVDADLARHVQEGGCLHCSGKLHGAKYKRRPRGLKSDHGEEVYRASFCCDQDGCRKRHTPPSVRFLGRKVYWGWIAVLVAAMRHGVTPERVRILRQIFGIDRLTLERWRHWWLETFAGSSFWKEVRARFMPPLREEMLPLSLCQAFGLKLEQGLELAGLDRLLELLRFLSPITTLSVPPRPAF